MQSLQHRLDSFSRQRRVKAGSKSTAVLKWPHPPKFMPNPALLAEAGFYWEPTYEDKDNVTCYMCGKELSDWDEGDDPFDIHFSKCSKTCSWAFIRCGLRNDLDKHGRFVSPDKNRQPNSKAMEKARLDTFGKWWVHDANKSSTCSSKKMAQAGFIYSAQEDEEDDLVICVYCDVSLSGWDEGDDPLEEHRRHLEKAGRSCAFLDSSQKALGRSTSKPPSRSASKSKATDLLMPTKIHDGVDESSDTGSQLPKAPRSSRAASKGSKSTLSQLQRSTRTEDTEEEDITAPARPTRKSTRSRSVSRAPSADEPEPSATARSRSRAPRTKPIPETEEEADEDGNEVPDMAPRQTAKISKSRSKAKTVVDPDENEAPESAPMTRTKKQSTRSQSTKSSDYGNVLGKSRSKRIDATEDEDEVASTSKKPPSKTPKKKQQVVRSEEEEDEQPPPPTAKKVPAKGKASARGSRAKIAPATESEADEMDIMESPPVPSSMAASTSKKPGRASRAKPKGKPEPDSQADEEDTPPALPRKSSKRVKKIEEPDPVQQQRKASRSQSKKEKEKESEVEIEEPVKPLTRQRKVSRVKKVEEVSEVEDFAKQPAVTSSKAPRAKKPVPPIGLGKAGGVEKDSEVDETTPVPRQAGATSSKAGRPPSRAKKPVPPIGLGHAKSKSNLRVAETDEGEETAGEDVFMDAVEELPPSNSNASGSRTASKSTPRLPLPSMMDEDDLSKTMEVEILSSGEDEPLPQPKPKTKTKPPISKKPSPPPAAPVPAEDTRARPNVGKLATKFEFPKKTASSVFGSLASKLERKTPPVPMQSARAPSPPPIATPKPPSPEPEPEPDVEMDDYLPEPDETEIIVQPQPVTPPRPLPPPSAAVPFDPPPPPPIENAFYPVLASEPFMDVKSLTEAELAMNVEEWIRFQMRLECERFERDMEREVLRFERRAQEVQRALEAL